MCDASNSPLGAVLDQSQNRKTSACHYVCIQNNGSGLFPSEASRLYKEKLKSDAKYYIWDDPYLWRLYDDQVIRRCILDFEITYVLQFCHATSGGDHYGPTKTTRKVLDCGFY
ncbi:hypothetical protein CR513_20385, partial [Mucuna pruriens]